MTHLSNHLLTFWHIQVVLDSPGAWAEYSWTAGAVGLQSRRDKTNDFHAENSWLSVPIPSMYGIFTYIWLILYGKCR